MVHCEVLRARKEFQKALEDADRAIRDHPENAEWYLMRSQLQEQLKLKKERIAGLEKGIKETGSGLLEAEWIDALIDGGKADLALEKIENELKDARLRSSWLIRRGKVRLAAGMAAEAKADLEEALAELNGRMNTTTLDSLLLADRGMTHELLRNKEDALKDYEKAREKGLADDWLRERIRFLKDDKKKPEETKPEENKQKADGEEDKPQQ
jgi:tetratricopeptide (TPR) repeat protein